MSRASSLADKRYFIRLKREEEGRQKRFALDADDWNTVRQALSLKLKDYQKRNEYEGTQRDINAVLKKMDGLRV